MAGLFDIIGPVMIGPSSSHTAGACRIGKLAKKILGEEVKEAKICLHGSFALTWKGHGTDKAILAGLLGFETDDPRLRDSYRFADESNLKYEFIPTKLREAFHPNSVYIEAKGENNEINILASSIGGGLIVLDKVNGIEVHYKGDFPTIAIVNRDVPGIIAKVTSIIFEKGINIENMNVTPQFEGPNRGYAIIVIGMTDIISKEIEDKIRSIENIRDFVFLDKLY